MSAPKPIWRKSSHSYPDGDCVEVAFVVAQVAVRDSKFPDAGMLRFSPSCWRAFLAGFR
ncbi:DUF397 domain-containing protein [Amycolatopsis cihanbeyliensis]|uniref:Uncharacterized protein DUF397 n=1 Tax=Amycolatopsis cihanbeyliensis TaxID=1128664 RepID=A0A542DM54_AMYCI|nr:DUF397 domain-containing protein [Amycolatopsis cihanbeyliensis]TQJ04148.1 uncharacterized protein DUF397 [Amycolatopsis cihanbeyliensis]